MAILAGVAVAVAVASAFAAALGDSERITSYWMLADVNADGSAVITEVIDYDFGPNPRRGVRRDVPGLDATTPVEADSPTAPDRVSLQGTEIRVGDPSRTITGRHRYFLRYRLAGVAVGGDIGWDAVGTGWTVPLNDVEIHLVAPWDLRAPACDRGAIGATGGCTVEQVEPGHLAVQLDRLDAGTGVTVSAVPGEPVSPVPSVAAPAGGVDDPGTGPLAPAIVAAIALLLGALPTSRAVRQAGREWVAAGGPADAAFGRPGAGFRRVDHEGLAGLATIEFAPPEDVTAAQGGVVLSEAVTNDHQVAWLLEAAHRGVVRLDDRDGKVRLERGDTVPEPDEAAVLNRAFSGRGTIELDGYDRDFAAGWSDIGKRLDEWRRSSGLWSSTAERRMKAARALGVLLAIPGVALTVIGAVAANRYGSAWLLLAAAGAALTGAAGAVVVRGWELRVRTPKGTGLWLRSESFRRFLAESEGRHAEEAARRGVLREYTAWAVAVGEVDRWSRAVSAAAIPPQADFDAVSMATIAPRLCSVTSSASTPPSSSGGGRSGGGVGSGAGGGGGGSW